MMMMLSLLNLLPLLLTVVVALPSEFDLRKNASTSMCVPPIQNQGECGSVVTIATVQTLAIAKCMGMGDSQRTLPPLSTAFVGLCDGSGSGCGGEPLGTVLKFLHVNGTVVDTCIGMTPNTTQCPLPNIAEQCAQQPTPGAPCCTPRGKPLLYHLNGATPLKGNVEAIKMAISNIGDGNTGGTAVAAMVDASTWMFYNGGVYTCPSGGDGAAPQLDHMVYIVGWGVDRQGSGDAYWIAANSWGTSWGEQGYILLGPIGTDTCGLESNTLAFS